MRTHWLHGVLALALTCGAGRVQADETAAETVLRSTDTRSGFVSGRTFAARPVTYTVVGDLAVLEGDIILGTVTEIEAFSAKVRLLEALKAMPEQHDLGYWSDRSIRRLKETTLGNIDVKPERRWPNATIPYLIDESLVKPERITEAMKHWSDRTRVRFVARESKHKEYVYFTSAPNGCASKIGMTKGGQELIVGPECTVGNMIHEIGHVLGLWHEHGREDRDQHITIDFSNIPEDVHKQFKQVTQESDDHGAYEYGSIMHYGPKAFAKDSTKPSIIPKIAGATIGQRVAPSAGDVAAVDAIYPLWKKGVDTKITTP